MGNAQSDALPADAHSPARPPLDIKPDCAPPLPSGLYELLDPASGRALDLSGADNSTVIGFPRHGGRNQLWDITRAAWCATAPCYYVTNARSGRFMADPHQEGVPAQDTVLWRSYQVPAAWRIDVESYSEEHQEGFIRIRTRDELRALQFDDKWNAKILPYDPSTPPSGRWHVVRVGDSERIPNGPASVCPTPLTPSAHRKAPVATTYHACTTVRLGPLVLLTVTSTVEREKPWLVRRTRAVLGAGGAVVYEAIAETLDE